MLILNYVLSEQVDSTICIQVSCMLVTSEYMVPIIKFAFWISLYVWNNICFDTKASININIFRNIHVAKCQTIYFFMVFLFIGSVKHDENEQRQMSVNYMLCITTRDTLLKSNIQVTFYYRKKTVIYPKYVIWNTRNFFFVVLQVLVTRDNRLSVEKSNLKIVIFVEKLNEDSRSTIVL